nr:zinc finger protein gis2 [Quercus suber]
MSSRIIHTRCPPRTASPHFMSFSPSPVWEKHTTVEVSHAGPRPTDARAETGKWDGEKTGRRSVRDQCSLVICASHLPVCAPVPYTHLPLFTFPHLTVLSLLRGCRSTRFFGSIDVVGAKRAGRELGKCYCSKRKFSIVKRRHPVLQQRENKPSSDNFPEQSKRARNLRNNSDMSSLSRRACYKCGNVGHYAEVCSSSERLCYNCKQPGHESNNCPHPRTTESESVNVHGASRAVLIYWSAKQCYHCQGLGHVQADCPTLRISGGASGGRCYSCGEPGHLARNCPTPNAAPIAPGGRGAGGPGRGGYGGFRGGFSGNRAAMCYKCGGPNHFARDCQAQAMKCYACGKLGHISRDCTAPNGGPLNAAGKTCYRCGEAGHISRDCPQNQVEGGAPVVNGDASVAPEGVLGAPLTPAVIAA